MHLLRVILERGWERVADRFDRECPGPEDIVRVFVLDLLFVEVSSTAPVLLSKLPQYRR